MALNIKTRVNWALEMMFSKGREALAIQTTRNHIYGTSFLATLCSALAFFITTQGFETDATDVSTLEYKIQLYFIAAILFISFTFFANSVRLMFHVQFLILAKDMSHVKKCIDDYYNKKDIEERIIPETFIDLHLPNIEKLDRLKLSNVEKVKRHISLASIYYSLGVRGLFIGIPIASWAIFGIWPMLGTSIALLIFFIFYDFL
eukprot:gene151-4397_t